MREAKFSHDFLGDGEFRGYTRDEDYNGFACPYFSYDQAMIVLQAWAEHGLAANYDGNTDELVFEVHSGEEDKMLTLVKKYMENAINFTVPMKVEAGIGANWLEAH